MLRELSGNTRYLIFLGDICGVCHLDILLKLGNDGELTYFYCIQTILNGLNVTKFPVSQKNIRVGNYLKMQLRDYLLNLT